MKRIGIVVAMQQEIMPFLNEKADQVAKIADKPFETYSATFGDKEVVCVRSGVGEIIASAATQYLLTAYSPEAVLNFGVCGSLTDELSTSAVAFVEGVVHCAFDTSAVDGTKVGQYFVENDDPIIRTDEKLLNFAKETTGGKIRTVVCASADKFVADEEDKKRLREAFGADVCEMESAGILITCLNSGVPCLFVKAISDGKGGAEEFKAMVETASEACADIALKLCDAI